MRTIVLGWINETPYAFNFGKTQAAVWLAAGTSADLREARRFASKTEWSNGVRTRYRVFVFRRDDPRNVLRIVREAMIVAPRKTD